MDDGHAMKIRRLLGYSDTFSVTVYTFKIFSDFLDVDFLKINSLLDAIKPEKIMMKTSLLNSVNRP